MDEEKKDSLKKISKVSTKIYIKKLLGIPHSFTGFFMKISYKIFKNKKNKKN